MTNAWLFTLAVVFFIAITAALSRLQDTLVGKIKYENRKNEIATIKNQILSAAAGAGYYVPVGFTRELYDTALHVAMRELIAAGNIKLEDSPSCGQWECWTAA